MLEELRENCENRRCEQAVELLEDRRVASGLVVLLVPSARHRQEVARGEPR